VTFSTAAFGDDDDDDNSPTAQRAAAVNSDDSHFRQPIEDFFIAESVRVQEAHELEGTLEIDSENSFALDNLTLELEYGLTDRWQASVDTPALVGSPGESTQDFEVSTEYALLRTNTPFALSAELGIGKTEPDLETPDGQRDWEVEPGLVAAKAFGKFQVQVGASAQIAPVTEYIYNVATVYNAGRFCPTLEYNGSTSPDDQSSLLTPGTYYHLGRQTEVGIAAPIRLQNGEDAPQIITKLTVEY
jgi:hypothetical protein